MSSPKCIVIGDPHFKPKNTRDVDIAITETLRLCQHHRPDFIVILGDVLDTHEVVYTPAYKRACTWIEALSHITHVYVLIGNHDYINQTQFLSEEHIFGALKLWPNVTIVDHVIMDTICGLPFLFSPYVEPGRLIQALSTCSSWRTAHTLFAHQEFFKVKMNSKSSEEGDHWDADYPNVISGHIHETQKVEPNIYYPGSLMQHDHGDSSFKSVWVVTFSVEGCFSYETFVLEGIKSRMTIELSFQDVYTWDPLPWIAKHHVRLNLTGTQEENKVFEKSELCHSLKQMGIKLKPIVPKIRHTHDRIAMARPSSGTYSSFHDILDQLVKTKTDTVQEVYAWLQHQGLFHD